MDDAEADDDDETRDGDASRRHQQRRGRQVVESLRGGVTQRRGGGEIVEERSRSRRKRGVRVIYAGRLKRCDCCTKRTEKYEVRGPPCGICAGRRFYDTRYRSRGGFWWVVVRLLLMVLAGRQQGMPIFTPPMDKLGASRHCGDGDLAGDDPKIPRADATILIK